MCEHGKGGAVPEFSENKISSVEDFNTVAPQIDQKVGVNAEGQYDWLIECNHGLPVYDLSKYRPLLEDIELTDAQASELLQIMWNIMTHFVDLGLNVDAISLLEADGGEGRSAEEKVDGPGQQQSGCGQQAKDSGANAQDSVE